MQILNYYCNKDLYVLKYCKTISEINDPKSIQFHLDRSTIDNLMTTFSRQIELAKYLANCEASNRLTERVLREIIPMFNARRESDTTDNRPLTLFGSNTDKIKLIALVIATGQTIENGFELAFKYVLFINSNF